MVNHLTGFGGIGAAAAIPTLTDNGVSDANATSYTFAARSIGPEAAGRQIVVCLSFRESTDITVGTVTVAGNSATRIVGPVGDGSLCEMWSLTLATGTTADIVVTISSGTAANCGFALVALNSASTSVHHSATADNADPLTANINIPANGACIAFGGHTGNSTSTWTGLTGRYDEQVEGIAYHTGACDAFTAAQTGLTVTADPASAAADSAFIVASWAAA